MWVVNFTRALWLYLLVAAARGAQLAVTSTVSAGHGPCTHSAYHVPNGGFESGRLGPWEPTAATTAVNISVVSTGASGNAYALRLQAYDDGMGGLPRGGVALFNVTTCAATAYRLSFLYRSPGTTPSCTAYATAVGYGLDGTSEQWTYQNLTKTHGFQKSSLPLNVTDGHAYNIYLLLTCDVARPQGPATIDFDQFQLHAVESLEPPGCPNRAATLANGDFETGNLRPWTLTQHNNNTSASLVHTPHGPRADGQYHLRVNFTASPIASPIDGDAGFDLVQPIPELCLAYNYDLSFDYRWSSAHLDQIPTSQEFISFNVIIDRCDVLYIPVGNGSWQTSKTRCESTRSGNSSIDASFYIGYGPGQPSYPAFALELDNFAFHLSSN